MIEFYVAVIVFGASFAWSIIEIRCGMRGPSEYLQTHFIVRNKVLQKIVIIKPRHDVRIGNKRHELSIFMFIPYTTSLLLTIITGILTLICGIVEMTAIKGILTSKITFIVLMVYIAIVLINSLALTSIDYMLQNKEWKQKEKGPKTK